MPKTKTDPFTSRRAKQSLNDRLFDAVTPAVVAVSQLVEKSSKKADQLHAEIKADVATKKEKRTARKNGNNL